MRRLLAILLCLTGLTAIGQGIFVSWNRFVSPVSTVCVDPPTPYLIWQGFECSPFDHGPEAWITNSPSVDPSYTGVVLAGTKSLRIAGSGATQGELRSPSFGSLLNEVWIYFLFRPVTLPAAHKTFFDLEDGSPGTDRWAVGINPDGTIRLASAGIDTSVGAMIAGTTYGVWIHYKSSGPTIFSAGFSTTGIEPVGGNDFVTSTSSFTQTAGGFHLGLNSGTETYEFIFDNVLAKTSAIGDNPP